MFSGISEERFGRLTAQEERLLDNVKKAFRDSDQLYRDGRPEDCMEPMCRAIDAAKTLRRSLWARTPPRPTTAGSSPRASILKFRRLIAVVSR